MLKVHQLHNEKRVYNGSFEAVLESWSGIKCKWLGLGYQRTQSTEIGQYIFSVKTKLWLLAIDWLDSLYRRALCLGKRQCGTIWDRTIRWPRNIRVIYQTGAPAYRKAVHLSFTCTVCIVVSQWTWNAFWGRASQLTTSWCYYNHLVWSMTHVIGFTKETSMEHLLFSLYL